MKKFFLSLVLLPLTVLAAQAQDAFNPYWYGEIQAGVSNASGEGTYVGMMSPAFSFNAGYRISDPFDVRFGLGGFTGKGYVVKSAEYYKYHFARVQGDFLWHPFVNLRNLHFLAGVGLMVGTSNGAKDIDVNWTDIPYFKGLWDAPKAFLTGRLGAGYAFPVGENVAITAEAVYHLLPDAVNSKIVNSPDLNLQFLAGLRFTFGCKNKKAEAAKAAQEAYELEQARLAAEKAAAEKAAAEAAAKAKAEAEARAAAEKAAAEKAAAEKAAAEEAALLAEAQKLACKLYFKSDAYAVQSKYTEDLDKVAAFLGAHPEFKVKVSGYCDSRYGTAAHNKDLSEQRAASVAEYLKEKGVAASQIEEVANGGTDAYTEGRDIKRNRVVTCELLK